jgi:hypothetical protein
MRFRKLFSLYRGCGFVVELCGFAGIISGKTIEAKCLCLNVLRYSYECFGFEAIIMELINYHICDC